MLNSKKFGTFGGVFTPSLLTILGVIMYLRLPWIIGQSGLIYTVAIIIIAHIISITTGLSVSSIATDKKVEAGGNYYIISRSLGLPIGGTLGLALFVGLSFSVSLYLIGFCESLLSVVHIPYSLYAIRLYGSIALLAITAIIFISTSLAIKTQYFILGAVLLSLVSIFLGGSDLTTDQINLRPMDNGESLFFIFGIFFPAVTGFTAGVQMSGDLKDPKKSIPVGTIAAIACGFIIYLALAIFIAYNIPKEKLLSNQNILMEIAWNPQLVVAGIWGATLSSAMGSILGAPRILQASSRDKVTPRFFAKGTGKSAEPRRALLLTFLIAEAGILIGDLNIIARIVSIFFISTYGLINLSYALESWASTDFRPSFKVPVWVGTIGALSCAAIMFELDVIAFIVATALLSLIYLYLKRKELSLESGDTWGSFWSSIVRAGLHRLNESVIHKRNWRPNILLFRGSGETRNHLLDLSKWLSGKTGIISDFELVETENDSLTFTKASQQVKKENEEISGIFHRRYECENVYSGIDYVSRFYGFSGVEPNTVLFGWPKNTSQPKKVTALLRNLITLDYNILLLNQDDNKTFGSFNTIDVWWRGGSNNAALALALLRFLHATSAWKEATVRLLIIIEDGSLVNKVHSNMSRLLQNLRQDAQVKIINNSIEKRNFNEIMKTESGQTDLTVIGLPELQEDTDFIRRTTRFVKDLKTVLFIKASTFFEPYYIGIERNVETHIRQNLDMVKQEYSQIVLPRDEIIANRLSGIHEALNASINEFYSSYILEIEQDFKSLGNSLKTQTINNFKAIIKSPQSLNRNLLLKLIIRMRRETFITSQKILRDFKEEKLKTLSETLLQGIENLLQVHSNIVTNCPETEFIYFKRSEVSIEKNDPFLIKLVKIKIKAANKIFRQEIKLPVKLKTFVQHHIDGFLRTELEHYIKQIAVIGYSSISELQNIFNRIHDSLKNLETTSGSTGTLTAVKIQDSIRAIEAWFTEYKQDIEASFVKVINGFSAAHHDTFQMKMQHFNKVEINRIIKDQFRLKKKSIELERFQLMPVRWQQNMELVIDFTDMELTLILLKSRLSRLINKWLLSREGLITEKLNSYYETLEGILKSFVTKKQTDEFKKSYLQTAEIIDLPDIHVNELSGEVQELIKELPETVMVLSEGSYKSLENSQFEEIDIVSVYLNRLVGYLLDTEFMQDLQDEAESFNTAIREAISTIEDMQRLIISSINNSKELNENKPWAEDVEDLDQLIGHSLAKLSNSKEKVEERIASFKDYVSNSMQASFDQMNPYLITQSTNNLKQYIFTHEQRKVLGRIEFFREKLVSTFQNIIVKLQYVQSESILFARRFNRIDIHEGSVMERLISFAQTFSPSADIYSSIPKYYKQLFAGENPVSGQFLVPQKKVNDQAERIYKKYLEGYAGAMLITGEPRSGKSSLSRQFASSFFIPENIYRLNPVHGGSDNPDIFYAHLAECFKHSGSLDQIFNSVPAHSVLIINNLELWWQRSERGFTVIKLLLSLIDSYSSKIFFIININSNAFRLINTIQNIEKSFLGIVKMEPFSAKDIEKAILLRHKSTGIKFEYNDRRENDLSDIRKARLFNTIFKHSRGNIGVAMHAWLSMIKGYSDDTIGLQKHPAFPVNVFNNLEEEWVIWLTEFTLHRELTIKRLCSIFSTSEKEITAMVEALVRSGLIVRSANDILKINPFTEHLIIEYLSQVGAIWIN